MFYSGTLFSFWCHPPGGCRGGPPRPSSDATARSRPEYVSGVEIGAKRAEHRVELSEAVSDWAGVAEKNDTAERSEEPGGRRAGTERRARVREIGWNVERLFRRSLSHAPVDPVFFAAR